MTGPRGLSPEEAAIWRRVTATIKPLHRQVAPPAPPGDDDPEPAGALSPSEGAGGDEAQRSPKPARPASPPGSRREPRSLTRDGLDGSWERRLAKAQAAPELTIDLHGLNLAQAHARVLAGLSQASAMGARVVLIVAGKPRPHAEHDARGQRRGAIRAKLLDWLAASEHAGRIAAVRPAHPRHGGAGAVYVVLRRRR